MTRILALLTGICGAIAIAGSVAACDRVVNLTPFYDAAGAPDSAFGLVDGPRGPPDSPAPPDASIAFPFDGAPHDGGVPDDGTPVGDAM
jgi:hypothetical protein